MKKIALLLMIVLVVTAGAQNPTLQWAKGGGGVNPDNAYSHAIDAMGNVYDVGIFQGVADFDPGPGIYTLAPVGISDMFIVKLDVNGNFIWAKSIGGTKEDYVYSVALDASDNVYITGSFKDTVDFDPSPGTFTLVSNGGEDIFITKMDPSGNLVWVKQIGGSNGESANEITIDATGNIYTTGLFWSVVDFDPGPASYTLASLMGGDIFVSKLDPSGNFIWAKSMQGNSSWDGGESIKVDPSGNVFVTGYFSSTTDFDPGPGVFYVPSAGTYDIFVCKLDASGNLIWVKSFGGPSSDISYSLQLDALGNVYTCGYFRATADFDPGASVYNLVSAGMEDIFISKLDASGNFIWAKSMGGTSIDIAYSMDLDATGNIYSTGYFMGTTDLDPGAGTYTFSSGNFPTQNIFISKLDAAGNFNWAMNFGSTLTDIGYCITLDPSDNIYTSGAFTYTVDFDPGPTVLNVASNGGTDAFVHKLQGPCTAPPSPTSVTQPANQVICANTSTTLSAIAISTGVVDWYSGATGGSSLASGTVFVTPALSVGTYTYYAEAYTCTVSVARTPITVTVSACTGIKENKIGTIPFAVYPNPTDGEFYLRTIEAGSYKMINSLGQIVLTIEAEQGEQKMQLTDRSGGVYYLIGKGVCYKLVIISEY